MGLRFTFGEKGGEKLFQGNLECKQCVAHKADGTRCKRKTCKMLPYCYQHTQSELGVKVGASTIQGAGQGLFATKTFKGSDANKKWIAPLSGQRISGAEVDRRYADATAPYTVSEKKKNWDGALKRYVGHYANSKFGKHKKSVLKGTNAEIALHHDVPWLKAQMGKIIKPYKEILAYYGRQYRLEKDYYSTTR